MTETLARYEYTIKRVVYLFAVAFLFAAASALFLNGVAQQFVAWIATVEPKNWNQFPFGAFAAHPMLWQAMMVTAVAAPIIEETLKYKACRLALTDGDRTFTLNRWGILDAGLVVLFFGLIEAILYGFMTDKMGLQLWGRGLHLMHVGYFAVVLLSGFRWWGVLLAIVFHGAHNAAILFQAYPTSFFGRMSGNTQWMEGPALVLLVASGVPLLVFLSFCYQYVTGKLRIRMPYPQDDGEGDGIRVV